MWGIPNKVLLILGGVLAVMAALFGAYRWAYHNGYVEAEGKYKPALEACQTLRKNAEAANKELSAAFDKLQQARAAQDLAITQLQEAESLVRAARDRALVTLAKERTKSASEIARLRALAAGPPATTQEEGCHAAEAELRRLADRIAAGP